MILVDTSAWVDLLGRAKNFSLTAPQLQKIAICPPIIQEILQGVSLYSPFLKLREGLLALPCYDPEIPLQRYLEAADLYRLGRQKGYTIRSSTDCLIAAIAIRHHLPVLHKDRDFEFIAEFSSLQIAERL